MNLHAEVTTNVHSRPEMCTVVSGLSFPIEDQRAFKNTRQGPTAKAARPRFHAKPHSEVLGVLGVSMSPRVTWGGGVTSSISGSMTHGYDVTWTFQFF